MCSRAEVLEQYHDHRRDFAASNSGAGDSVSTILLHDLVGLSDLRFSPYCWRVKLALAHKGLAFRTRGTPFTAIPAIAGGTGKTVPVIEDGDTIVSDSFAIAEYLEKTYPDRPSLFGGSGGHAMARFVESWANVLHGPIGRMVVLEIHDRLLPEDRAYFRKSREQRMGAPLEQIVARREDRLEAFRESLLPLRLMLKKQPFIGGAAPNYADYVVFGSLQWPRMVSAFELVARDDVARAWFDRVLDAHDGFARKAPATGH